MNYIKIHNQIILRAQQEYRIKYNGTYYERHHIIPKCLDGNDNEDNLVLLTAREHYIIHKLLMYIYKGNTKLAYAYCMLAFNKKDERKISSREYEYARKLLSLIPISEETRKKISNATSGEKNGMYRKHHSEESKQKIREAKIGMIVTKETGRKISKALKDKPKSKEHNQKNREAHLGNTATKGYKRIHKENKNKTVKKEELPYYLELGWELGMLKRKSKEKE